MSVFEAPWSAAPSSMEVEPFFESTEFGEAEAAGWQTGSAPELESPFRGGATYTASEAAGPPQAVQPGLAVLESPFQSGFAEVSEAERDADTFRELLAEFEDEQFDEAIAQLVDEAAGLHLASGTSWSSAEAASAMAIGELEAWVAPLRDEVHRMLDSMADRLEGEELETLREPELEALFESLRPDSGVLPEAFENFLGGLFNKAKSLVKGAINAAKKGIAVVGKVVTAPVRFLLGKLKALAGVLLRGVLQKAIGLLPSSVQPIARTLAARLLGEAEAEALAGSDAGLGSEFDVSAASLMLARDEAEAEGIVAELEAEAEQPRADALSELDDARARLAEQLTELPAGQAPLAEVEQFLPALLAARPLIRMGLKLTGGRDKLINFLGDRIAGLIKGMVGADAARALSRPLVDVGLSALGLEAPAQAETIAGEALASTVEETVDRVLELPAEAFEDSLRMEAEIQEAFAEAAARNIPAEHLRSDLPQIETAGGGGVWVLMPRAARPHYRYKKYSRVFFVPITRQVAAAIPTADGGTIETMLLDHGVGSWPANAEVHLYETLPHTTHLGQIAQFESEGSTPVSEAASEFHPLTPEAAAMLLHEPGLGRSMAPPHHHHHDHHAHQPQPSSAGASQPRPHPSDHLPPPHQIHSPRPVRARTVADPAAAHPATTAGRHSRPLAGGHRYFQIRLPGQVRLSSAKPRHRVSIAFERRPTPVLHVQLRLSEREGQRLAELLQRNQLPSAIVWLKDRYQRVLPAVLTARVLGHRAPLPGRPSSERHAVRFSLGITNAVTQALSAFVRERRAELMTTVQNAAQGITFTFTFDLAQPAAPGAPGPDHPRVRVQPGFHHAPATGAHRPHASGAHPPHASAVHHPRAPEAQHPHTTGPHHAYGPGFRQSRGRAT